MERLSLKTHLSVPESTLDALTFAKPNNDAIRQWIRKLPKANLGEMARQLYLALQELNPGRSSGKQAPLVSRVTPPKYSLHLPYTGTTLSEKIYHPHC